MANNGDNMLINEYRSVVVELNLGASIDQAKDSLRDMAMPLAPEIPFGMPEFEKIFEIVRENCNSAEEGENIFSTFEVYCLNLIHKPWRKEYQVIKKYTGVYQNMQIRLKDIFEKALEYLGYVKDSEKEVLQLKQRPKYDVLKQFAIDCFIGACKFRFLGYVFKLSVDEGYTWKQVKLCKQKEGSAEQYVTWMRENIKPEKSPKKLKRRTVDQPVISNIDAYISNSVSLQKEKEVKQNGHSDMEVDEDISDTDLYGHGDTNPLREEYKNDITTAQQDHFASNHLVDLNIPPLEPTKVGGAPLPKVLNSSYKTTHSQELTRPSIHESFESTDVRGTALPKAINSSYKSPYSQQSINESRNQTVTDNTRIGNGRSSDKDTRSHRSYTSHTLTSSAYKTTLRPRAEKKGRGLDSLTTGRSLKLDDTDILSSMVNKDPKYSPGTKARSPTEAKQRYPTDPGSDDELSLSSIKLPPQMDSVTTPYNAVTNKFDTTDSEVFSDKYDDEASKLYGTSSSDYRTNAVRTSGILSDQYSYSHYTRQGITDLNLPKKVNNYDKTEGERHSFNIPITHLKSDNDRLSSNPKNNMRNLTDISSPSNYLDVSKTLDKTQERLVDISKNLNNYQSNDYFLKYANDPRSPSLTGHHPDTGGYDLRSKDDLRNGDIRPLYSSTVKVKPKSQSLPRNTPSIDTYWECSHCTTLNRLPEKVCSVCSKSRSKGNEEKPLPIGGKLCEQCEFVNKERAPECEMCQSSLHNASTNV